MLCLGTQGLLGRVALSFLANLSRKNLLVQEILWGKYLNDELFVVLHISRSFFQSF